MINCYRPTSIKELSYGEKHTPLICFLYLDAGICIPTPRGGCDQWRSLTLGHYATLYDTILGTLRQYTVEECYGLCKENIKCGGFIINRVDIKRAKKGTCMLYNSGCTGNNSDVDYYDMTNCSASGMLLLYLPRSKIHV